MIQFIVFEDRTGCVVLYDSSTITLLVNDVIVLHCGPAVDLL